MTRYYIEHDGRLSVSREGGRWTLPEAPQTPFDEYARRTVRGTEVVFGQADLDEHPAEWPKKDDLAHDPEATPLVHAAINATLFRPVVGVLVFDGDEILLVMPSRGVAQGIWTLPGGFVNAFEQPHDAARREVREEAGIELEGLELTGTVTYRHHGAPYPILGLGYSATAASRDLTLREGEIEDARWARPREALEGAGGIARAVIDQVLEEDR